MGSSSGDDYSMPPPQPAPPGNLISPPGTATPYQPNFINFLGDPNTPATGLTPQMLAAINATNGPPPGTPPPAAAMAAAAPAPQQQGGGLTNDQRIALAIMMAKQPKYGQGNRSDWGGSRAGGSSAGHGGGGPGWGGGIAGGVGGRSSGGLY